MRCVRKGFTPLLRHKPPWLDCFINGKKLRGSSMYYAFKESEVLLNEACNNLLRRYIVAVNNTGRILNLNTPIVDQLKNTAYQLTQSDSYIIGRV
jgi:hypothetical protein